MRDHGRHESATPKGDSSSSPTQPTQPAEGEPVEIPIPERDDVMRDLRKMAKPPAPGPPPKKPPRWAS